MIEKESNEDYFNNHAIIVVWGRNEDYFMEHKGIRKSSQEEVLSKLFKDRNPDGILI